MIHRISNNHFGIKLSSKLFVDLCESLDYIIEKGTTRSVAQKVIFGKLIDMFQDFEIQADNL